MISINNYFDKVFCINISRRTDRWAHVEAECQRHQLTVERFEGHDNVVMDGRHSGDAGCTASHRGLLELISHYRWPRTLILEDDFKVVVPNLDQAFSELIQEVPDNWDMLYLGGGYGCPPKYRHSPHVIRINHMLTTSSYAVTDVQARRMAPHIFGIGPIDSLYETWNMQRLCYIFQPRLIVQRAGFSDLQECESNNETSMLDEAHENMLLTGTWQHQQGASDDTRYYQATVTPTLLSTPTSMNGLPVVIDNSLYTVLALEQLPPHEPPWRRGEACMYKLRPQQPTQELAGTIWKPTETKTSELY